MRGNVFIVPIPGTTIWGASAPCALLVKLIINSGMVFLHVRLQRQGLGIPLPNRSDTYSSAWPLLCGGKIPRSGFADNQSDLPVWMGSFNFSEYIMYNNNNNFHNCFCIIFLIVLFCINYMEIYDKRRK